MSLMHIPLEIYELLEKRLGRDDAMAVAKSIEASLSLIEERSREIAGQRKLEVKEELRVELRDELTTKGDLAKTEGSLREEMAKLEGRMEARFERLDKKFSLLFMATIFAIIFVNQNALEFLARVAGLIK
ncbi:hypothetical protein [Pelomicrobium methylotrophicum]|uniref:DUF1640 domain-containing protein n=1 Tax=Pelomicrobium methylotrophicum TaxID=2602750 RepID=A0A5C7EV77_9PROT|nr:hypothetical protein [Pelomicrobium methylotrophicum]TXF11146.1 hypothetical protein FR698_11565 [Pelomicrobium methylotrophicum]